MPLMDGRARAGVKSIVSSANGLNISRHGLIS